MADLGVLGGTFNPPHIGHLVMVGEALNQLGLDHTKLTFRHAGRDFKLTDVSGNVVKDLIA